MSIAMRPLSQPPFPLERIEEMTALMQLALNEASSRSPPRAGRTGSRSRRCGAS